MVLPPAPGAPPPNGPAPLGAPSFGPGPHVHVPHHLNGPPPPPPPPATRWVWCVTGGLLAVVVAALTTRVFIAEPRFRLVDQAALLGAWSPDWFEDLARSVLGVVSEPFLVVALAVAAIVALVRQRWGDAVRAAIIVAGANLTTQVLKELLERPVDVGVPGSGYGNSLPSGHTTVAASIAAIALVVAPRAARPLVAVVGAAYAAATGVATVALGWHRPSDLLVAFAIVAAWSLLVLVPTRGRPADGVPGTAGRVVVGWLLGLVAVVGIGVGLGTLGIALGTAGSDLSGTSAVLEVGMQRLASTGSAAGIAGVAALCSWALLLARR